ncbi:phage tail assembly chaperone [Sphingomonas sp. SRS2]|nr:phage tail assembly chaperone [Sphingomonas sp. SRS2]
MGIAILDLHWSADQFWNSTPHEFFSAVEIGEDRAAQRGNED